MKIGLVSQWPTIKNAEYELLEKIKKTSGHEFYLIDYLGYEIKTGIRLDYKKLDFAITFHYSTPHYVNCFTYCAILNPIEYMLSCQDYTNMLAVNYLSHNEYLIAKNATVLKQHLLNLLRSDERNLDFPEFYPSVSEFSVLASSGNFKRIFYCGVNWERMLDILGRHESLLQLLDKANCLDIYGPKSSQGRKLWSGYNNYKGAIPFDGVSILKKINEYGICLVLSSDVHFSNEHASSRVYEACAAGAIIISDNNPFIVREFGDAVLYIDKHSSSAQQARQIIKHYEWILQNPLGAKKLAEAAQAIFLEKFVLEKVFAGISDDFKKRSARLLPNSLQVSIVIRLREKDVGNIDSIIHSVNSQEHTNIQLIVVCLEQSLSIVKSIFKQCSFLPEFIVLDSKKPSQSIKKGEFLKAILPNIKGKYVTFLEPGWYWHYDHLSSMVSKITWDKEAEPGFIVTGVYEDTGTSAPMDVSEIQRFFGLPVAADFTDNKKLIDLPMFLIDRKIIEHCSDIINLFENYEGLLFYYECLNSLRKIKVVKSFTARRAWIKSDQTDSKNSLEKIEGFWEKVSDPMGDPSYELKLIYDRFRFSSIYVEPNFVYLNSYVKKKESAFIGFVKEFKKRSPLLYMLARIILRMVNRVEGLLKIRTA